MFSSPCSPHSQVQWFLLVVLRDSLLLYGVSLINLVAWLFPQRNLIVYEEFTIHVLVVAMVYH